MALLAVLLSGCGEKTKTAEQMETKEGESESTKVTRKMEHKAQNSPDGSGALWRGKLRRSAGFSVKGTDGQKTAKRCAG